MMVVLLWASIVMALASFATSLFCRLTKKIEADKFTAYGFFDLGAVCLIILLGDRGQMSASQISNLSIAGGVLILFSAIFYALYQRDKRNIPRKNKG